MYQYIEEAREIIEEYNQMAEMGLQRDYLVDKVSKILVTIEKEFSNFEDRFHSQQRELKQYRNKYGDKC